MTYDTVGDIVILKFKDENKKKKLEIARRVLKEHKHVKTILEKAEKIKGRLRTLSLKFLLGENKRETIHRESGCLFKLNIEKCYFSPRMSNDRLEIAKKIKKGNVLCLFSGVAPYPIIISKKTKASRIVAIELGRECCKFARENVKLNKLENIEIIQGDVNKIIPRLKEKFDTENPRFSVSQTARGKQAVFDFIVMARPQLKDTFLASAFKACRKGTIIFYHGFGKDIDELKKEIKKEAIRYNKKIKFLEYWKNGDIAPYTFRWTITFKLL